MIIVQTDNAEVMSVEEGGKTTCTRLQFHPAPPSNNS
jgi:hypothetical protein